MLTADSLNATQPSYIREILSAATAEGIISLAGGLPAPELLPMALLQRSMATVSQNPTVFQYGETRGFGPLVEHLTASYDLPDEHGALVCTGSQQALDLIARAYLNRGDTVAMEAPSYLGALQVFQLAEATIKTIPQGEQGPDLDALETLFASGQIKLFYAVPDFHNPTGLSWTLNTRKAVAELCQRFAVTLIEDAPYREIRFSGEALPLVSSFCPDHALTLRSFSKISAPGIRLGVVTGPSAWLTAMITVKQASDLHSSMPMQALLFEMLKSPEFAQHVEHIRGEYKKRYLSLYDALNAELGDRFVVPEVSGGMFLWLPVPGVDPRSVSEQALKQGLAVVPSDVFYTQPSLAQPALRLNFSHASPDNLIEGARRLNKAIAQA